MCVVHLCYTTNSPKFKPFVVVPNSVHGLSINSIHRLAQVALLKFELCFQLNAVTMPRSWNSKMALIESCPFACWQNFSSTANM